MNYYKDLLSFNYENIFNNKNKIKIEIRFLGRSSPAVSYGAVNNAYQQPPLLPPQFNPPLNNYPPPLANNFYPPANNYPPPLANNNYPPPLANNNYPPPLANNNFLPPPDLQNYNNVNRELFVFLLIDN